MRPREGVRAADAEERQGATSMTTAQWTATYPRGGKGLVKGYLAKTQRDLVSHSLKPKRTAPVWTQVWEVIFPGAGGRDPDDDQAGRLHGHRGPGRVRRGLGQSPRRAWARRRRENHGSFVNVAIARQAGRREWIGLAVLALPCLLYAMDLTVLNLAVPHLSADLQPSSTQLLWIVDIYGFMAAGSLVTMGTLGDRIGRRRLLLTGGAAFGATSLLAAWSTSAPMLIAARALLGVAGATVAPSTLSLIRNMFLD